jgi:hypothetical protein
MLSLQTMPHPLTQIEIMHRLKKVGFTQEQAETHAEIVTELNESNLATKQDVLDLEKRNETEFTFVRKDISDLRKEMRQEFALVRTEMKLMESHIIIKMSVIMSGLLALFGAAQKVFGL